MLKKYLIIFILFFCLFYLSACANDKQDNVRRVPEVMMGSDCGFDKLKCCSTSPTCNYGQQCCVDPNDAGKNYCSENCSCGDNEEFCCADNQCNGNAVCVNGLCSTCGGKDQVCCTKGDICAQGNVCSNNKCVECGLGGQPCCAGSSCIFTAGERSECLSNTCVNCGFDGSPTCTTGDKCLPGQILTGKNCERCGGQNQPCCQADSGEKYDCDPIAGLKCNLGFCSPAQ